MSHSDRHLPINENSFMTGGSQKTLTFNPNLQEMWCKS